MNHKTHLTAHSGCDGTRDNSLGFVRYALGTGVDAIEVDVRRNDDGALIMAHDFHAEDAPLLRDAMRQVRLHPTARLHCDLKNPELELAVWHLAQEEGMQDRLIYSGTANAGRMALLPCAPGGVAWFLNLELVLPMIYTRAEEYLTPSASKEAMYRCRDALDRTGAVCLNTYWKIRETRLWDLARDMELPLSIWTPDDPTQLRFFFEEDVYNVTTRQVRSAMMIRATVMKEACAWA